jgi:hypothetical protein
LLLAAVEELETMLKKLAKTDEVGHQEAEHDITAI